MRIAAAQTCRTAAALPPREAAGAQRPRGPAPAARRHAGTAITAVATPWHKVGSLRVPAPWRPAPQLPAPPSAPPADSAPLAALWQAYMLSLERHPLLTKAATSFLCVCLGDSAAQYLGGVPFSASRVLRIAAYAATVGTASGHYWHRWLEAHVCPEDPTSNRAVGTKVLMDQLLLTPVMTAVFFAALKLMEGRPEAILPFMQDKYLPTLLAGYAIWFPWNYASFRWIHQDLRILAGNLVGIGWGAFVSVYCINSSSPPSACPAALAAAEGMPSGCPAVLAAVEAATLGPQ